MIGQQAVQPVGGHDTQVAQIGTDASDPDRHFQIAIRGSGGSMIRDGVWAIELRAGAAGEAHVHFWQESEDGVIMPFPRGGAVGPGCDAQDQASAGLDSGDAELHGDLSHRDHGRRL